MSLRNGIAITTYAWSLALAFGAKSYQGKEVSDDLSINVFLGALAWLHLIFEVSTPLSIFCGVSLILGAFWGIVVMKDFQRPDAGLAAILAVGTSASYVIFGNHYNIGGVIGGIIAPVAVAIYFVGFGLKQTHDAVVKANGGETSDEIRWRREKEERAERRRSRNVG